MSQKPGEKPIVSRARRRAALRPAPARPGLADAPRPHARHDRRSGSIRSFVPIATLWVGKLIIDGVVAAQRTGESWRTLGSLIAIEIAIVIAGELLARASSLVEGLLGDLFGNRISVRLMEHAATLDLAQFEDPEFYDHLERARRQTTGASGSWRSCSASGRTRSRSSRSARRSLAFSPWLVVLLVARDRPELPRRDALRGDGVFPALPLDARSGGSSTICAGWARATTPRRKSSCSGSRAGSPSAIACCRSAGIARIASSRRERPWSARRCR